MTPQSMQRMDEIVAAVMANPGTAGKRIPDWNRHTDYDLLSRLVQCGRLVRFRQRLFAPGHRIPIETWMAIFPWRRSARPRHPLPRV